MFLFHQCQKIDENTFNEKIPLQDIDFYIEKYKLNKKGQEKEYWINNLRIISNENKDLNFTFFKDIEIYHENNFLIQEYEKFNCNPYNFYNVEHEENYEKYENIINDVEVILKKFEGFFTICFSSNNKENFKDFFLYNNNNNNTNYGK